MSDERVAVLCDLFEQVLGAPIEEHQLRSLAVLSSMTQGDGLRHWAPRASTYRLMLDRLTSDAVNTSDRMWAQAMDLDARWTAAMSIKNLAERAAWMSSMRFNSRDAVSRAIRLTGEGA